MLEKKIIGLDCIYRHGERGKLFMLLNKPEKVDVFCVFFSFSIPPLPSKINALFLLESGI